MLCGARQGYLEQSESEGGTGPVYAVSGMCEVLGLELRQALSHRV